MEQEGFYKEKCVICLISIKGLSAKAIKSECRKLTSYTWERIKKCAEERDSYGNDEFIDCMRAYNKHKIDILTSSYHIKCHEKLTNKTMLERLKKGMEDSNANYNSGGPGHINIPPNVPVLESLSPPLTRREAQGGWQKSNCILCNKTGESSSNPLHSITTASMCSQFRGIFDNTLDEALKLRLNPFKTSEDPLIGVTLEVKYHTPCLLLHKRNVAPQEVSTTESIQTYELSLMELVSALRSELSDPDVQLHMTEIKDTFVSILETRNYSSSLPTNKTVKAIVQNYFPDAQIIKSKKKNVSEYVVSKVNASKIEDKKTFEDEVDIVLRAAKILRKLVLYF